MATLLDILNWIQVTSFYCLSFTGFDYYPFGGQPCTNFFNKKTSAHKKILQRVVSLATCCCFFQNSYLKGCLMFSSKFHRPKLLFKWSIWQLFCSSYATVFYSYVEDIDINIFKCLQLP